MTYQRDKGIRLFFDDSNKPSEYELPLSAEDKVIEQMKRPQKKRLYIYGTDFSRVTKVEIYNPDKEKAKA